MSNKAPLTENNRRTLLCAISEIGDLGIEISLDDLRSSRRESEDVFHRALVATWLKANYDYGPTDIGRMLDKTHCTVIHWFSNYTGKKAGQKADFPRLKELILRKARNGTFTGGPQALKKQLMYHEDRIRQIKEELATL